MYAVADDLLHSPACQEVTSEYFEGGIFLSKIEK